MHVEESSRKLCSFVIAFLPLFSIYKSPIPKVDLGLFALMGIILLSIVRHECELKLNEDTGPWILYIVLILLSIVPEIKNLNVTYLMTFKNILYVLILVIAISGEWLDYPLMLKYNRCLVDFSTAYMIAQTVMHYAFSYPLYGFIPNLVTDQKYVVSMDSLLTTNPLRPMSVFYEPSHYAVFVLPDLLISLFDSEHRSVKRALWETLGIILSTSGAGILFTAIAWCIYLGMMILTRREYRFLPFLLPFIVSGGWYFSRRLEFMWAIERINEYFSDGVDGGRAGGYRSVLALKGLDLVFGRGFAAPEKDYPGLFFTSWSFILYCLGMIGIVFYGYLFCTLIRKCRTRLMMILLMFYAGIAAAHTVFNGFNFLFYFSFPAALVIYTRNQTQSRTPSWTISTQNKDFDDLHSRGDNPDRRKLHSGKMEQLE